MAKQLRLVVVGSGYFGQKRIAACLSLPNEIALVGIIDIDRKKGQALARKHNLLFSITCDGLSNAAIDAAIIATPNRTHAGLTLEALACGWHVLCEKPLAVTHQEAQKIVRAAKKHGRFVKTGSNHRFFPTVQKAYALVRKGTIGNILSFKGSIGTDGSHTARTWFWDKKLAGGGTFIDNGCHLLDIARWFMGDFVACAGRTSTVFWHQAKVEDTGSGIFVTQDGRQAVITSSWTQWGGYLYFEIWGDKGFLIVDSRNGDTLTLGKRGKPETEVSDFSQEPKDSYHKELLYFRDSILKHRPPEPSALDGAKVIQMIEGVYRSSKEGKWVKL